MLLIRSVWLLFFISGFAIHAVSQVQLDSTKLSAVNLNELLSLVEKNHPIAKQINLISEQAKANLLLARAGFDPSITSNINAKEYEGKNYYRLWNSALKVPTWYGLEFKGGYELNNGIYVNDEDRVPPQGLFSAGLSVPVGQGLLIDQRRTILRQAKLFVQIAESERILMLNDLYLQVISDYWNWWQSYRINRLRTDALQLAEVRFLAVRDRVTFGDMASIDSTEAYITVEKRRIELNESQIDLRNTALQLSVHLWNDETEPLELSEDAFPSEETIPTTFPQIAEMQLAAQNVVENHPKINAQSGKIKQLELERRFKADLLKPNLRLEYNFIQQPFTFGPEGFRGDFFANNYKFGLGFYQPIMLRKERAGLKLTKIKLQEADYELTQVRREISNKLAASTNELFLTRQNLTEQTQLVRRQQALRDGEQRRFDNGESSVFMINMRESTLVAEQIKEVEFSSKTMKSSAKVLYNAGLLQNYGR